MKICIYGAGAIGGLIACRLAEAGAGEISIVARGPHLAAIRENGLAVVHKDQRVTVQVRAEEDPAALGPQDLVIVSLKAHSLPPVAEAMSHLLGPDTVILSAQNGIPWWYFHKEGSAFDGQPFDLVDHGSAAWRLLGPERVIGGVIYIAASVPEPGVIEAAGGKRLVIGEPDGTLSPRLTRVADAMKRADLDIEVSERIRNAVWAKLIGNVSYNPVSVLVEAATDVLKNDPLVHRVLLELGRETQAVGEYFGATFDMTLEERLSGMRSPMGFRTSMLQDYDAGRPLELDSLVGAVCELGRRAGIPTPTVDTVYALTRLKAETAASSAAGSSGLLPRPSPPRAAG